MVLKLIENEIEVFARKKHVFLENLKRIAKKYRISLYLFGSRARNENLPSSDMDILVVIPQNLWKLR